MPASLLRSRYFVLGVVALLFGTVVLSVNFANEYVALNGETGLMELPSVHSMLRRTGLSETSKGRDWSYFLEMPFYRIGGMALPYSLSNQFDLGVKDLGLRSRGAPLGLQDVIGIVVFCTCLIGLAFIRQKILWATLVLSGFCWSLPIHSELHVFERLFYIGLPLVFFSLVLLSVYRLSGLRLLVVVGPSAAAVLVFIFSSFQASQIGHNAEAAEIQENVFADFEVTRKMTTGKRVLVLYRPLGTRYFLAGSILLFWPQNPGFADFIISNLRQDGAALLTPDNKEVFLYDPTVYDYEESLDQIIKDAGKPLIHAEYREHAIDVYLDDNRLYYVRSPRSDVRAHVEYSDGGGNGVRVMTEPSDPVVATGTAPFSKPRKNARFFLHVFPVDVSDLSIIRKRWGFDNLDFKFKYHLLPHGKRAIAVRELPHYDIARIETGQFTGDGHGGWKQHWRGEIHFDE